MNARWQQWGSVVLAMLCAVGTGRAAYLDSDYAEPSEPPPPPRFGPPIRIEPPPDWETGAGVAVRRLLHSARPGTPWRADGFWVVPVEGRVPGGHGAVATFADAVGRGDLLLRERGEASVPWLRVRNVGPRPVFLLAGQVASGGKQNRTFREDVLVPADGVWLDVPVYCVERRRWIPEPVPFAASGVSHPALRRQAAAGASQDAIWGEVSERIERLAVRSGTEDYQAIHGDPAMDRRLAAAAQAVRELCVPDTIGLAVVRGGALVALDLFSDPALFARLRDELARSYALECYSSAAGARDEGRSMRWDPRQVVRRELERAAEARTGDAGTPGLGRSVRLAGAVQGRALVWDGVCVHVALWP